MYYLGWGFFVLLTAFIVAAVSNGSNLNDGMDGMAAGNSAIIALTLGVFAYISSNAVMTGHLNLMYIPGSEEVVVFLTAFVGALIGYLWYNSFPAQIFMGDTGSLTIGGIIAVTAVIIHKELLLPLLCGIFLIEILSDIDVKIFLKRGKKHRIWKKGPFHDHFRTSYAEFKNKWPNSTVTFKGEGPLQHEVKITIRFWIVTIMLAALTLLTLKIR
jgi:phospho-N-acetylmuramoyl-pentapeptide-transferase